MFFSITTLFNKFQFQFSFSDTMTLLQKISIRRVSLEMVTFYEEFVKISK